MRKLKIFEKFVFVINSLLAFALLLSYVLPYVEPRKFAFLSVLSLAVPFLIIVNILFVVYWLLKVKKQLVLSLLILVLGYNYVFSLYKFTASKNVDDSENISVMNYNVRLFNLFDWIDNPNLKEDMSTFLVNNNPDILCMQEYRPDEKINLKAYPYKYIKLSGKKIKNGQAIYTKFPIINSGSIEFPDTSNNAIFADIVKNQDTIRVYNLHLESSRIDPNAEEFSKENSQHLFKRVGSTFEKQQSQAEQFLAHRNKCTFKTIISGDFNNTAYSYIYNEIKGDMKDTFKQAGNGFGRTFDFKFFPVRIDFVLVDDAFEINAFKTFDVMYSDHYPVMAKVKLKD
ncbi:MAG: endonuclease/exonuclease/phosphatase family metal-dependent hydrolase [Psychroserpens sp.]|jgi:endonuclease/exonuclease/phosphatase family metal-dependent hydrolase|uniref:endonuclease/exonuclease/phosphatase family protein n=1 Tax=Psychroserpens sp. TaxID=2020870 RepID=UPI0039E3E53A